MTEERPSPSLIRSLGMDAPITRRDFINGVLIGAGAALLNLPAPGRLSADVPSWDGYGGVGDYARSHGNTEAVRRTAHGIRDGLYDKPPETADTGEFFDLVIVGGGLSGLGAAHRFRKKAAKGRTCLILENHPVPGGEAKRNEFIVQGQRLIAPQGANSFVVLNHPADEGYDIYRELDIPTDFHYAASAPAAGDLWFDTSNFGFMFWFDSPSVGYFFEDGGEGAGNWVQNFWRDGREDPPYTEAARRDLHNLKYGRTSYLRSDYFYRWLDSMTYKDYLEKVMKFHPDVSRFMDPILASTIGLGTDAISAFGAHQVSMPGFTDSHAVTRGPGRKWQSFPGGLDGIVRFLVKSLIPGSIEGGDRFEDIYNGTINFSALDDPAARVRMRLASTAVRVEHNGEPENSDFVKVTYVQNGKAFSLKARAVAMASGSWVAKRVVRDIPETHRRAMDKFIRSPVLVVNVALTNWRFLRNLGLTACRWFDGFGFSCNIRRPMTVGDYKPPLDPARPAVLTLYVPFFYPGLPAREQGVKGRKELLSKSFSDYEILIRKQMLKLFGNAGFDPGSDIAGIILNRWGHAYVNPQPGFYFGQSGEESPSDVVRKPFGRIAFGHSEHNGHQHWVGAVEEGARAVDHLIKLLK